jgi:hypothetical protein
MASAMNRLVLAALPGKPSLLSCELGPIVAVCVVCATKNHLFPTHSTTEEAMKLSMIVLITSWAP